MARTDQNEKKRINPILWFLFAIVIPLIIILIIVAVSLNFAGFNVVDWAREKGSTTPVLSNFVSNPDEKQTEADVENLSKELQVKNAELEQLEFIITDLETEIADLENELSSKEEIIARYESNDGSDMVAVEEDENETRKEMAKTFEEMKAASAAAILGNMDEDKIVLILMEVPNEVRGDILQAMDPELAASLTSELME